MSPTIIAPLSLHAVSHVARLIQVLISEVLKAKHAYRWVDPVIHQDATVGEAIQAAIEGELSGMMVVEWGENNHKKVVGLLTSRDLLRIISAGLKDEKSNDDQHKNRAPNSAPDLDAPESPSHSHVRVPSNVCTALLQKKLSAIVIVIVRHAFTNGKIACMPPSLLV